MRTVRVFVRWVSHTVATMFVVLGIVVLLAFALIVLTCTLLLRGFTAFGFAGRFNNLGRHVDRWNGQRFPCAPPQIATRPLRAAVRQLDHEHDVWTVLDEFCKRSIIPGDLKSAIRPGGRFADEIVGVFIAIVPTHAKALERFAGRPLSDDSDNGVRVHHVVFRLAPEKRVLHPSAT